MNDEDANNKKLQEQRSTQENKQDLEQQQQVDVKPAQLNFQKIDFTINTKLDNYSGEITGIIYKNKNNIFAEKADIYLYFGCINDFPVCKTNSDENGKYSIVDLPPGFYTIKVIYSSTLWSVAYNIKVLPGQNSNYNIYLTNQRYGERRCRSSRNAEDLNE